MTMAIIVENMQAEPLAEPDTVSSSNCECKPLPDSHGIRRKAVPPEELSAEILKNAQKNAEMNWVNRVTMLL